MTPRLVSASDRGILVVFDDAITPASARDVRVLQAWLLEEPPAGLVDLNPAYASLLVRFDPLHGDPGALADDLLRRATELAGRPEPRPRSFEVRVRYGGEEGPDLPEVARATGLAPDDVVALHAGAEYEVGFIGFSPGFPYLSGLPDRLHTARRESPRARVAAGSVAVVGAQAGIYPIASPAGWNVIGRTDFVLFDAARDEPATLAPGDRVRFVRSGPLP